MEQLHFITKLLDIKDPNIHILDIINKDTHKEIIAKLDYDAPSCPECGNQLKKYDFQKPSKIPYLETTGMPTRILLRKRRRVYVMILRRPIQTRFPYGSVSST
ncbi:transposase [Streptococcus pneumoniae]|nr:transposase [Streptococcus pneumoniae]